MIYAFGKNVLAPLSLRGMDAKEAQERLSKFNSTVLQRLLLLLYIVYPGVSVAIVQIYSCTTLADGRSFLNADLHIQCYDTMHYKYIIAGAAWIFVVPIGVPAFFIWLLRRFKVPQLAAIRLDNAWLREAVKKVWEAGVPQPEVDVQVLAMEDISEVHLDILCAVLLYGASKEQAADMLSGKLSGVAFEEQYRAEKAKKAKKAEPKGMIARVKAFATGILPAIKKRFKHALGIMNDEEPEVADKVLVGPERRQDLLERLLYWSKNSGRLAVPVINWDDLDAGEDEDEGEAEEESTAEKEPALAATQDLSAAAVETSADCEALRLSLQLSLLTLQHSAEAHNAKYGGVLSKDVPKLKKRAIQEVGFLISSYRCGCWYWEVVELFRKLILTSVISLVAPGSATQVTVGCLISFVMLLLNLKLQPFYMATLNEVNTIAQLNLFFFLFVGILLCVPSCPLPVLCPAFSHAQLNQEGEDRRRWQ